jgi:hypothetical protein
MNLVPGTHSLTGSCPRCGEDLALRVSIRFFRDRPRDRWQTRGRLTNIGTAHECADSDTYPLFPTEAAL